MQDNIDSSRLGVRLGNYRIQEQIGQGGMGTVYRAEHTTLGSQVAIKVLSPRYAMDPAFVARFEREARAAAALSHSNIVNVIDAGNDGGVHYIVMEFVRGQALSSVLAERGKIGVPEALLILRDLTQALIHAHERGIVHRDITPGNVMLTPDGQVKLADMGLAKQVGSQLASGATETGATVGTPYYMSPEQVVDSKGVDPRTDLYSLGATLYHLISGKRPFDGGSAYEIMRQVETEAPVPLQRLEPDVPRDVCRLIERLMEKDAGDRYQSAEELFEDIEHLEAGGHIAKYRKRLKAFRPVGYARRHWKTVVVAGVSAAAVATAVILGFLLAYKPDMERTPVAISVWSAPATGEAVKVPPTEGFSAAWPVALPSAPVEVETIDDGYVFTAGKSRMATSPEGLTVTMTGLPLVTGDFADLTLLNGTVVAGVASNTLDETSEGTVLETTYGFGTSARAITATRRIFFNERTLLVEWHCDPGQRHLSIGLLANSDTLRNTPDLAVSMTLEGRVSSSSSTSAGPGIMRIEAVMGPDKFGSPFPTDARVLITSIPAVRREAYGAIVLNGGLTVSLPNGAQLLSDRFFSPGRPAVGAVPTGYYRSEDGEEIGYRLLLPPDEEGAAGPLIKSLLFTAHRVRIEWLWDTEAGQVAFQVAPSTVLGRSFVAKLAGNESVSGMLSTTTKLENVRALLVDLGDRTVSFTGKRADYAFDGEHVRLVHTAPVEPGKPRTGKLVIEFATPPTSE